MVILPSLLLLASAQAAAAAAPLPAEIHNFGDWSVACDNGLRCQAVAMVPETAPGAEEPEGAQSPWDRYGVMMFERGPEADAPLVITISDFEGTPASISKYDEALNVRFLPVDEGNWRVEAADQKAFLDALYSENLVVKDAAGKILAEIALGGAWGSIIYMDERQGRLRTASSLLRPGSRPLSVIPPAPPLPVIAVPPVSRETPLVIPARQLATVRRDKGCLASEVGGEDGQESVALGNGRTLVLMSCGAGAYNFNSLPLIAWREGRTIRIEEANFDVEKQETSTERLQHLITNAQWNPARNGIEEYSKGRGLGDCGVRATYVWDGRGFRLADQMEMSECRGTYQYLTTWRTQTR